MFEIGESFQDLNEFQLALHPSTVRKLDSPSSSPRVSRATNVSPPSLWSVDILLDPIIQRFRYHFRGTQKTNDLYHPEWYYSFALDSIQKHKPFLDLLQRILDDSDVGEFDIVSLFISGVCSEIVDKLSEDIGPIEEKQDIFWNTLNETLSFKKELRHRYDYTDSYPHPLRIFYANYMDYWVQLETECKAHYFYSLHNRFSPIP